MNIIGTDNPKYQDWLKTVGTKINGAYLYAREIEQNILPSIETDDTINTVAIILYAPDEIPDESVVVAHDNYQTVERYRAYFGKRLRWICSMESTRDKLLAEGEFARYIPLSVDFNYIDKFKKRIKTADTAFFGNLWLFKQETVNNLIEKGVVIYGSMTRELALSEIAKYKKIYAEGRCAIEAQRLGAKILPLDYGDAFDSIIPKPYDNRDLIPEWQKAFEPLPTEFHVTFTKDIYPYCVGDKVILDIEDYKQIAEIAKGRHIGQWCEISNGVWHT